MADQKAQTKIIEGTAVHIAGDDIDTDRIIPARFMLSVTFEGLGEHVFCDERFTEKGKLKEHPLNDPAYQGATILLVHKNFGCGSSREHAPQALKRFGFKAFIGESFAEIFISNCTALGMPAVTISAEALGKLIGSINSDPKTLIRMDLLKKEVYLKGMSFPLSIPESARLAFVEGTWDTLNQMLLNRDLIQSKLKSLPYLNLFSEY
jgi:3-isopropylmalate/(R)-2-methylmalate dehydratase small subunit